VEPAGDHPRAQTLLPRSLHGRFNGGGVGGSKRGHSGLGCRHRPAGAGNATGESDQPAIALAPDGRTMATPAPWGPVRIWNLATGLPQYKFDVMPRSRDMSFSPDGKLLAVARDRGRPVILWDAATARKSPNRPLSATASCPMRSRRAVGFWRRPCRAIDLLPGTWPQVKRCGRSKRPVGRRVGWAGARPVLTPCLLPLRGWTIAFGCVE
jgi:hypothetical protein